MRQLSIAILSLLALTSFAQDKDSVGGADSIKVFFVSEPVPEYPGGFAEMQKFIKNNLKRPKGSRDIKGKVYIAFIVNENGSLSDLIVVKGIGESFDKNALEVIRKMPNWIPAKKDNKPLRTKMVLPITFD